LNFAVGVSLMLFSKRATGFRWRAKLFELNFFINLLYGQTSLTKSLLHPSIEQACTFPDRIWENNRSYGIRE